MLELDPKTTALVLIDLQKGIMRHELKPYPADRVTKAGSTLADTFAAPPGGFPEDFSEFIDGLAKPDDILVTKRQWGAFHGTELDLQLRRRGIQTIVLGGVATNIGVESTARQAWEHGYAVVLAEDATSAMSAQMHDFAIGNIFPRISRVVKSADLTLSQA